MHLNKVVLIGVVSDRGPKLTWNESGIPTCSFVVQVDETNQAGKTFKTRIRKKG
jgi:hypothetical protein